MNEERAVCMKKRKKRVVIGLAMLLGVGAFLLSPLFSFVRSLAVMGIYSAMHESKSLMAQEDIQLRIPGGWETAKADWYPFVMTYVADADYARYIGEPDAKLTILYNFPAFAYGKGCSRLFDRDSVYYNGFYGAYFLRDDSNEALARGELDEEVVANVAKFDFFHLVLGDFGLKSEDRIFDFTIDERIENVPYIGYEGWTKVQAAITVNGSAHPARKGTTSYLQYGAPNFGVVDDAFAPITISGTIYGRYFPEWDAGVYFYVMGDADVCRDCDEAILSKSILKAKK